MTETGVSSWRPGATAGPGALRRWFFRPEAPAIVFLAALALAFAFATPNFATLANVRIIAFQIATIGIIALAVNQVILAAEIDISMGSMLGLCAVVAGMAAEGTGGFILPLAAAMAVGTAVGAVNGLLVTKARIPAIIVTLGMLYALRGVVFLVTGGASVVGIPLESRVLGRAEFAGLNYSVWLLLILLLTMEMVSRHTVWGRDVYAVGGNRRAARLAGLPIDRTRFVAFTLVGLFTGIASMVYIGQTGGVQTNAGTGLELQVIAAVVLGGTSISGGRGSTLAPVVGAALIGVVLNGMILLGIPGVWQNAVLGALILLAITTDAIRRRLLGSEQ